MLYLLYNDHQLNHYFKQTKNMAQYLNAYIFKINRQYGDILVGIELMLRLQNCYFCIHPATSFELSVANGRSDV